MPSLDSTINQAFNRCPQNIILNRNRIFSAAVISDMKHLLAINGYYFITN